MNPADKEAAVLIVDDQESVHRMTYTALRARGVACRVADSRDVGVDVLREHAGEVCCALVDVNMPAMDGLAIVTELRTIQPNLPCLLVTGSCEVDEAAFLASGALGVISRPFTVDELQMVLARLCDLR